MSTNVTPEHPFAAYVRILGKGKTGTRSLTQEEARDAFGMILRNEVEPLQLGAFLMLLRVKEESPEELAGFVQACRDSFDPGPAAGAADLDWSSYAGKKHQHPWFLLAMLLLNQAGFRLFVHGSSGHTPGRLYTREAMQGLGLPVARDWQEAAAQLEQHRLSFLPLAAFCPGLDGMMQLKPILGLRSPVNTLARMLNPLRAEASIQSIFHPAYARLHAGADRLLGQPRSLVFKGDSGEVEIRPQADTRLHWLQGGELGESQLARTFPDRVASVDVPALQALRDLWRGAEDNAYGLAATLSTTAVALQLLQPGTRARDAQNQAATLWAERDLDRVPESCP